MGCWSSIEYGGCHVYVEEVTVVKVAVVIVIVLFLLVFCTLAYVKVHNISRADIGLPILRFITPIIYGTDGVKIIEEDWDYLIILDASRHDTFEKIYPEFLNGTLKKKKSLGTCTTEWLYKNFYGGNYDIVYVSANPWTAAIRFEVLDCLEVEEHTNFFFGYIPFSVNIHIEEADVMGVTSPQIVNEYVKKSIKEYPDKRMIIHYMQPHSPFIPDNISSEVWGEVARGEYDLELFKGQYENNLRYVLKYVRDLLPLLEGKVIITSDHGNCFKEYGLAQHPWGIRVPELVNVPWFEVAIK